MSFVYFYCTVGESTTETDQPTLDSTDVTPSISHVGPTSHAIFVKYHEPITALEPAPLVPECCGYTVGKLGVNRHLQHLNSHDSFPLVGIANGRCLKLARSKSITVIYYDLVSVST